MNRIPRPARRCAAALLLALAACGERGEPLAPAEPGPGAPSAPASFLILPSSSSNAIACQGSPSSGGTLQCSGGGGSVQVAVSGVSYDAGTQVFSFDATVQNLIPQPIGTTDPIELAQDPDWVRVFFSQDPVVTGGSGSVSVVNEDGTDFFTSSNQAYFQYDTVLKPSQVSSARQWQFSVPSTVATFSFALSVSAAVPYPDGWVDVSPDTVYLPQGTTQQLTAVSRDAYGVAIPGTSFTWSTLHLLFVGVNSSGVITGSSPGTTTITANDGTRRGTAWVQVCPNLAVGGVAPLSSTSFFSGFCLSGTSSGAEYTLALSNVGASGHALTVRGTGIVPAFGPPTPTRLPVGRTRLSGARRPQPDGAWERRLRERERRELAGRIASMPRSARTSAAPAPRFAIVPGEPLPGDFMDLNVATNACSTQDLRTGEVKVVGTNVIVMADTANPASGLTTADYQDVADVFDNEVWPVVSGNFGAPEDIDANSRVILFYTRAVNEGVASGGAYVPGYFLARDLFSSLSCPTSNVGEMIYMMAADPSGAVNGNARSVAFVKQVAAITLAHEMQHLVNASRRLYVNSAPGFEEVWLDEGLSGVAEELLFYQAAGLTPAQNLDVAQLTASSAITDAFFAYAEPSFARLRQWLLAPTASGLFQADNDAATRGAAWAYLRYVAHRKGGSQAALWSALVNSTSTGMSNVGAAAGADGRTLARDFVAATYTDDAISGVAATWTQPAWNFRSVYGALDYDADGFGDGFPLAVRNPANNVEDAFTPAGGGGAGYVRMGVGANGFGSVTLRALSVPNFPLRVVVIRRK